MKKDTANSSEHTPSGCRCNCNCHTEASESNETKRVANESESVPTTPNRNASEVDSAFLTPPRSDGSYSHNEASSSKRRRLISFDSNTGEELDRSGTATKLNYESTLPSDVSEVSTDHCVDDYLYENIRRTTVQRLWQVNYGEDGDRHIRTTGLCKLYEFVTWYDVVKNKRLSKEPWTLSAEEKEKVKGKWKCRGSGRVKFIQNLMEGYNCGMIRMEMIHEGTLNTLMCHQLIEEPVSIHDDLFIHFSLILVNQTEFHFAM